QPDDDDIDGRFTFADGKLTITGRWKNSGKPVALSGQLVGDRLELTGAGGMTILRRGSAPGAARH
ncbi:MAG TPA: hypothetical protein VK348_00915, partial [Planctomycetota bacterium]|nr:hypothetical protein [Planctomycetota bacterium]